jgi:hypothetical protein
VNSVCRIKTSDYAEEPGTYDFDTPANGEAAIPFIPREPEAAATRPEPVEAVGRQRLINHNFQEFTSSGAGTALIQPPVPDVSRRARKSRLRA